MPKKRQISSFDSDNEEDDYQPKKRTKTESKEVITIDSDEDVMKTPKTPKTKKKEVQKNTLDKYFGFSSKTTPKASKDKEKDKAVTPKASGSKVQLDESPKRATNVSPKKLSDTSPKSLLEFKKSPTKLVLHDEEVKKKVVSPTSNGNHKKIKLDTETKSNNEEKKSEKPKPSTSESVNERKRKIKEEEKVMEKGKSTPAAKPKMGEKRRSGGGGNYAAYMNRDGPREIGLREIPEGEPNCLSGMTFVLTGVLESIEREDAKNLIEKCGGKMTGSLSKKTTYLVAGREPGISKLNKADQLKIKQINEDEFFNLIPSRTSSEKKPVKSDDETESAYFSTKKEAKPSTSTVADQPIKGSPVKLKKTPHGDTSLKQSPVKSKVHPSTIPDAERKANDSRSLLWVDKYRPRSLKQLIGQQTPGSVAQKLLVWLRSWHRHMEEGTKKSGSVGFTRGGRDDGSLFKAALLSGPPGIGKTTTATLVCEELKFSYVELNASDTRSKRSLREQVSEAVGSHSVVDFIQESNKGGKQHCLLMDEVDGMAGNEDRGGIGELIQLIKQSKIPIICMCNDRSHQKMRSLVNYCFDLRFQRPRVDQIKGAMMSIICKEGLSIPQSSVTEMVTASNNDIRQTINNLEMWSASDKKLTDEQIKKDASNAKKDLKYNVFDVIKKILVPEMNDDKSIRGMSDLFFQDYQMGPLFVQENYLNVRPTASGGDPDATLTLMSKSADAIAMGDIVNRAIRTRNNWSLLTTQALFSTVLPGHHMRGNLTAGIVFPSWLGKFSSRKRCARLLQQLSNHVRLPTGGVQPTELAMGTGKALLNHVATPLLRRGPDGVEDTIDILRNYDLLREDLDLLAECTLWSMQRDPMSQIDSKTKAALTRTYNKSGVLTPYTLTIGATKKGRGRGGGGGDDFAGDDEFEDGEENPADEEAEDNDDVTKDAMVKVSKAKAGPSKKAKTKPKANSGSAGPSKKKKAK